MFFSTAILGGESGEGLTAEQATMLIGLIQFSSTAFGMVLLSKFGRKTLMIGGMVGITLMHVLLGKCILLKQTALSQVYALGFIFFFGSTSGPITWLYMAEIMEDTGTGIASALNWLMNIFIAALTPYGI